MEDKNKNLKEPGTCKNPECRCIHEHGLVTVQNADGSVSQYSEEQAKSLADQAEKIKAQLPVEEPKEEEKPNE